jgi:DNA repair ATPase RecN
MPTRSSGQRPANQRADNYNRLSEENELLKRKIEELTSYNVEMQAETEALKQTVTSIRNAEGRGIESASSMLDTESDASNLHVPSLPLKEGQKVNLSTFVNTNLFGVMKFLNEDTLQAHPLIIQSALTAMGVTTPREAKMYEADTKRELKEIVSKKRNYSKKRIMAKYKGKSER